MRRGACADSDDSAWSGEGVKEPHPIHAAQVEYGRQEARVVSLLDKIYGDLMEGK